MRAWTAAGLLVAASVAQAQSVGERVAELRPQREAWQQIGWRTDLDFARREAARLQRPLYVWAMNGHPLGCT